VSPNRMGFKDHEETRSRPCRRWIGGTDTINDRVTIEWTNSPDGPAKQFRREWSQGDGMDRRKNLPCFFFE
ncbi:hypothetical protein PRIPAC_75579, partial [Pristionchus pacificus]|uniref:Uncharacterized protein n=1 Tax=Pristionchus pacificus TaxID=54126 RepID=A0A2A6CFS6_PRIPA